MSVKSVDVNRIDELGPGEDAYDFIQRRKAKGMSRAEIRRDIKRVLASATVVSVKTLTPSALLELNVEDDPDCLIGRRFLCAAGSLIIQGPTGIGKSTLAMQMALYWALGLALFGITPARPLKTLFIQAENDPTDLAEMLRGALASISLSKEQRRKIDENLLFVCESSKTGKDFAAFVERLARQHRPDLVFIDPFLSFIGGDVSSQKEVGPLLRNHLTPLAQTFKFAYVIIHHTGKPKDVSGYLPSEFAYFGIGSSEIANWSRASIALREVESGLFELRTAKRGERAGMIDRNGHETRTLFLEHSRTGLCWEESGRTPLSKADKKILTRDFAVIERQHKVRDALSRKKRWQYGAAIKMLQELFSVSNRTAKTYWSQFAAPIVIQNADKTWALRRDLDAGREAENDE